MTYVKDFCRSGKKKKKIKIKKNKKVRARMTVKSAPT